MAKLTDSRRHNGNNRKAIAPECLQAHLHDSSDPSSFALQSYARAEQRLAETAQMRDSIRTYRRICSWVRLGMTQAI